METKDVSLWVAFLFNQTVGHGTHAFFASPPSPAFTLIQTTRAQEKFLAEYDSVERILREFGLQMAVLLSPHSNSRSRLFLQAVVDVVGGLRRLTYRTSRVEVLQDLGMVGLLAFAKMAVDDLFRTPS